MHGVVVLPETRLVLTPLSSVSSCSGYGLHLAGFSFSFPSVALSLESEFSPSPRWNLSADREITFPGLEEEFSFSNQKPSYAHSDNKNQLRKIQEMQLHKRN
jgi:hypothetical protein